ncbi:MAG: ATP-grasp domain-containing protein [Myxococcales bacterium]|nr:ATP-grasp domain-containing protein [Myxococcales bacterium]USN51845.1 MAG: ATP-grasp domain-containing protein [Myxococcales bacterium]
MPKKIIIFTFFLSYLAFSENDLKVSYLDELKRSFENDLSESSSTSSTIRSSLSTCTSASSIDSSEIVEDKVVEPQYDYFDEDFIQMCRDNKSRYVLLASGFSESSLLKMNPRNRQKQKRSFPMTYLLADKINNMGGKSMIIYQTTARINEEYRKYLYYTSHRSELENMNENQIDERVLQFERKTFRFNVLSTKGRKKAGCDPHRYLYRGKNAYRRIKVPKILNRLERNRFENSTLVGFTGHFTGPTLEKHAQSLRLPYLLNPSSQGHQIKKSRSRQSFRDAGVRHPRGTYEPAFTLEDITRDIYNLLMEIDYPKLVLKLDESAGGYGNKVMKFEDFSKDMDEEYAKAMIRERFNNEEEFPPRFIDRIEEENGGAIVEEFIVGKDFTSPATVYMITGKNQVSMRYTYDQILGDGDDAQDFKGSLGPVPLLDDPSSNIELMSEKIAHHLSEIGVRGNVGTDFVIITNQYGERLAYAIENNVRNTGTSYPYNALKMLIGEGRLRGRFIKAFDDVKIPLVATKAFREKIQELFYRHLRTHPLSFNKDTARGCLVHHDTFSIGKIGVVCAADSSQEALDMFDKFTADAVEYIEALPELKAYENYSRIQKESEKTYQNNSEKDSTLLRSQSTISFEIHEDQGYVEELSEIDGEVEKRITFIY